jgi:hypothetical protein
MPVATLPASAPANTANPAAQPAVEEDLDVPVTECRAPDHPATAGARIAFDACVGADWINSETLLLTEAFRSDYSLSPFNREIAALLKQLIPKTSENFPGSDESAEAAIVNDFKVNPPDNHSSIDQPYAPDSPQYQSVDATDGVADGPAAAAAPVGPAMNGRWHGDLPEPFNTLVALAEVGLRLAHDTKQFLRENEWMYFCALLAFVPLGITQFRRRKRRYR